MLKKNKFSIILALVIMYLSLANSENFDKVSFINIKFLDKIVHSLMYFSLMLVILFENRKILKNTIQIFLISFIPFCFGAIMEILQLTITQSRSASIYDAIFNYVGILVAVIVWLWIKPYDLNIR